MKRCGVREYYPRRTFWNCLSTKLDPSKKSGVAVSEIKSARKLNVLRHKIFPESNFGRLFPLTCFPKFFQVTIVQLLQLY